MPSEKSKPIDEVLELNKKILAEMISLKKEVANIKQKIDCTRCDYIKVSNDPKTTGWFY